MKETLILLAACLLTACGQTGALYLPDEGITTPVEIRPAPAGQPSATDPPEGDEEEDQDEGTPVTPPTPAAGN
jgi:predicted small lipoprotein YifL